MAQIVILDRVAATKNGEKIKSVKHGADILNGCVLAIDTGLVSGEREVYAGVAPKASTTKYVLVASPEVVYDNLNKIDIEVFTNVKDKPLRGIVLCEDDIISLTDDCLEGTPAVGSLVELQAKTKMKVVTTATSGSTQVGKIIAIENRGGVAFNVIEVQ